MSSRHSFLSLAFCILIYLFCANTYAQQPNHGRPEPTLFDKGNYFLANKQYQQALDTYKEIAEQEPQNSYAFRGMVRSWMGLEKAEKGEKFLKNYLLSHESSDPALYALGYLYYLNNQLVKSEEYLSNAITNNSENSLALNNLAAVYAQQNKIAEAEALVKKAIRLDPTEMIFFTNLLKIYSDNGFPEKLSKDYRESKETNLPKVTYGYGMTLARQKRQEGFRYYSKEKINDAINSFLEILNIYKEIKRPSGVVATHFSLGLLYEEQGNTDKAKESFLNVLEINPDHLQARERIKALKTR